MSMSSKYIAKYAASAETAAERVSARYTQVRFDWIAMLLQIFESDCFREIKQMNSGLRL